MKFVHIADVHWGAKPDRTKSWGGLREREIKETFKRVLSYIDKQQVDLLLISGDFFQNPPSYQEVREIDYLLGKLQKTNVVWIAGNHDHLSDESPLLKYPFHDNVHFLTGSEMEAVYFPQLNTTVYGFSYWTDQIEEARCDRLKPTREEGIRILLAHGGDESHIPMNREALKWSGFDYIALGHIHRPEIIFEDLMAYAGSLEPLDHTETGAHGFIEGEITEEKQIVKFVPFASRRYMDVEVTVSEAMGEEEILDRIETELSYRGEHNLYKVIISGKIDPQISPDFEVLSGRYLISEIRMEAESRWGYEQISKEDDLLMQKVAGLLKDEPKALSYAVGALMKSRE